MPWCGWQPAAHAARRLGQVAAAAGRAAAPAAAAPAAAAPAVATAALARRRPSRHRRCGPPGEYTAEKLRELQRSTQRLPATTLAASLEQAAALAALAAAEAPAAGANAGAGAGAGADAAGIIKLSGTFKARAKDDRFSFPSAQLVGLRQGGGAWARGLRGPPLTLPALAWQRGCLSASVQGTMGHPSLGSS
jgi:hypothetical protein